MKQIKKFSSHTMRTIMFSEMARVMNAGVTEELIHKVIEENITNKKTKSNILKTQKTITSLYSFDFEYPQFKVLQYFWNIVDEKQKPLLAFLFAYGRDYLLFESTDVVLTTPIGEKVLTSKLEENLEKYHPNHYSENTRRSIAQNIASSWKQSGYITGKVKNIRTKTAPDYFIVTFALILAYLDGIRGDFLFASKWVKVLDIIESQVRELALEAARRDLLQYNYAGGVTTISFGNLYKKLNINGINS
ncbi:MAG: hypothetical protein ABSF81_17475 [Bacteroidales bacterium]